MSLCENQERLKITYKLFISKWESKVLYLLDIRLIDSLILLDVIGGRDGAPLSPGVRNNLTKPTRRR